RGHTDDIDSDVATMRAQQVVDRQTFPEVTARRIDIDDKVALATDLFSDPLRRDASARPEVEADHVINVDDIGRTSGIDGTHFRPPAVDCQQAKRVRLARGA